MRTLNARALMGTGLLFGLICAAPFPLFRNMGQASASAASLEPYGGCTAPSHEGINICQPGEPNPGAWETSSPMQVIAAATSGRGQVQTMEVWADGKKLAQSEGTPLDLPVSLSSGTHTLTVVEIDTLGDVVKSPAFQVSVQGNGDGNCPLPSSPGVKVCSPTPNGCNTEPWVEIAATGKGQSGTVSRMELWVNGNKIANFPGDRINTSLIMMQGTIKIDEVDSKGATRASTFFYSGPC